MRHRTAWRSCRLNSAKRSLPPLVCRTVHAGFLAHGSSSRTAFVISTIPVRTIATTTVYLVVTVAVDRHQIAIGAIPALLIAVMHFQKRLLAGRRGHTVRTDRVVSAARSQPAERCQDSGRVVLPSSASFHRRDSLSLSPCYAARWARLSVEPGAFPPLGRSATRVPLQRANTCGQSSVVPYGDGESVPSKLVADKGDDPSVGRRWY